MAKTIAIIGAGGAMGKWFSEYFSKKGFEVTGFDNTNPVAKNIKKAQSLISAILNVDYVLLSTPTKKTPEIIRLIAKEMKRESYLIDITSQKSKTATALGKIPAKVSPICIHPMFGPGAKNLKNHNIVLVPIKDGKKELNVAKTLFPDGNFVTIDSTEHDKKIAMILGMTESPELIETIISNPEIRKVAEEFWKDVGRLLASAQEGKGEEIIDYINTNKEKISQNVDLEKSYKKLTKMVNTIDK